jgi:hypothetical protein
MAKKKIVEVAPPEPTFWETAQEKALYAGKAVVSVAMLIRALLVGAGFGGGWYAKPEHVVIPAADTKKKQRVQSQASAAPLGFLDPSTWGQ